MSPPGHGNDLLNYYIQCFSEFERIGDYAVNLTENAEELRGKGIEFSETAQQELQVLGEALREIMDYAYRSFTAVDAQTARRIEPVEEVVDDMVADAPHQPHPPSARRAMYGLRGTRVPRYSHQRRAYRRPVLQPRRLHHLAVRSIGH